MTRSARLLATLLLAGTASAAVAAGDGRTSAPAAPTGAVAKPPPFAAQLAEMPRAAPGAHPAVDVPLAWSIIARSTAKTRQAARWKLATALLSERRGAEALGVLETMQRDDNALDMVPAWRLAIGKANVMAARGNAALTWFNAPELMADPEACAWRIRAGAAIDGAAGSALLKCAVPGILAHRGAERAAFLLDTATGLNRAGHHGRALKFLAALPDQHSAANLQRGIALIATGQQDAGKLRLERVMLSGTAAERAAAELTLIRDGFERGALKPAAAAKRLDTLTFRWRGGEVERTALELKWQIAERAHDPVMALVASATLFRHFDLGAQTGPTLTRIQAGLLALVNDAKRPIAQSAGLFWEYRDLSPTGAPGDLLVSNLADRLSAAGLHVRAAELLQHQMQNRAIDIAKGPLSVRIARLLLLADKPDQVLAILRRSDGPDYPAPIAQDRRRMQVIATWRMGRREDALAMLDHVDGAADLRAEMLWQARDWKRFVEANRDVIAPARKGAVLRQAVALVMLGDEPGLAALRQRYLPALKGTKAGEALGALASPNGAANPAALDAAMAGVSETTADGDLLLLARG
ncbi:MULTISPECIES: endoglucanase [unclassified Sphingomonas]|uniref:endoglucanase n=1 Tax=unclassified Sphingomonas TaxID=196159 RepID=UPI0021513DB0|nr:MULTISPECIES: endoglucanase [unclassified Sphingomonas]MCR5869300.1 endoglucanase [Sphingomonas sp. J344]UUX98968.1 endoglucanase [Sphingomonas sp. J315]